MGSSLNYPNYDCLNATPQKLEECKKKMLKNFRANMTLSLNPGESKEFTCVFGDNWTLDALKETAYFSITARAYDSYGYGSSSDPIFTFANPYGGAPDLAVSKSQIAVQGNTVVVTVKNLGKLPAKASEAMFQFEGQGAGAKPDLKKVIDPRNPGKNSDKMPITKRTTVDIPEISGGGSVEIRANIPPAEGGKKFEFKSIRVDVNDDVIEMSETNNSGS
jgi:hypothetical protein